MKLVTSYLDLGKFSIAKVQFNTEDVHIQKEEKSVHHIFVVDASGSMHHELPKIRRDIFNKISTLLKSNDSVTILWFSSKNEFGIITEDFRISSPVSLQNLKNVIERDLISRNMTAFKDPLIEVKRLISRVGNTSPGMVHSLFFLTDGVDNSYSDSQILEAVKQIKEDLVSATIVEYGYYCNRRLLNEMALEIGGVHVFSANFQDYEPYISDQFSQKIRSERKKVTVGQVHGGILFTKQNNDVLCYKVDENGEAFIDMDHDNPYFYLIETSSISESNIPSYTIDKTIIDKISKDNALNEFVRSAYMAMFAFSRKSDYNTIGSLLKGIGDSYFIKEKSNTFGTQKINELEAKFIEASNNSSPIYTQGFNPDLEPEEDAYNVLNLIADLSSHDENLWYPLDERFDYKRTGRKAEKVGAQITTDQKKILTELIENNKTVEALEELKAIKDGNNELVFEYDNKEKGSPFHDLVWNNSRANLSVSVKFDGYVNLPENSYGIPTKFATVKHRNYTIINDGIVHTYSLPVSLHEETFNKLQDNGLLKGEVYETGKRYLLDFSSLPVINQKMVKEMSAEKLFKDQYSLLKIQARNTVFNHLKKLYFNNLSKGFVELYGEQGTQWLKDMGLASYGFNPKTKLADSTEETQVNTLTIKIDKMTLPDSKEDFNKIMKKMDDGKELTPREKLLVPAITEFKTFESLNNGLSDKVKQDILMTWLTEKGNQIRREKTRLMNEISKCKFTSIVGKAWFNDLESRDKKEMLIEVDGEEKKFILEDKMETIKL